MNANATTAETSGNAAKGHLELQCLISCESTAEWRRRKQDQYPEDRRNERAAELLDALEIEMAALEGSAIHARLLSLYYASGGDDPSDFDYTLSENCSEIVSAALRDVGFYASPNAVELCESIADAWDNAIEDARQKRKKRKTRKLA